MKISRKGVVNSATNTSNIGAKPVVTDVEKKYDEPVEHIKAAIDILGKSAKTDILAKEAIANLSVVLLELK